jgi:general secretion pathway protein G
MQRAVARKHEGSEAGFTLIELLIVILILGILAAIVVLSISAFQNTGNKQACNTSAKTLESAAAAYYADNNAWPASIDNLLAPKAYIKSDPRTKWAGLTLDASGNASGCPAS